MTADERNKAEMQDDTKKIYEMNTTQLNEFFELKYKIKQRSYEILDIIKNHRFGIRFDKIYDVDFDPEDKTHKTLVAAVGYAYDGNGWDEDGIAFPLKYLTMTDDEIRAAEEKNG